MINYIKISLSKTLHKNLFIAFIVMLLFTQCQEPYFNNDLDANEKIPVFNAVLSNIDKLNAFNLYYASAYTDQKINRISGALITIENEQNNKFQLTEYAPGFYNIPNGQNNFSINHEYIATIVLPNGDILKSLPMYYHDTLPIANVYFDYIKRTSVVKNSFGEFVEVNVEGVTFNLRLKEPGLTKAFYRADANYYVHSQKWVNQTKLYTISEPDYTINYEIRYDTLYDIYEGFANTEFPTFGELLPNVNYTQNELNLTPLFLPADRECRNFSNYTSNTFIEWVVPLDLYQNSYEVYKYYTDAAKQLVAPGQIFDPIPEQIVGNMYNETNPSDVSLGLFDVSSVNRKYLAVYVHEEFGYRSYRGKTLNDTIIEQGWYPRYSNIDTVFIDSIPVEIF